MLLIIIVIYIEKITAFIFYDILVQNVIKAVKHYADRSVGYNKEVLVSKL